MNIAAIVVFLLLSILARSQECNIDPHYCDPAVELAREEAERAYHEQIEKVRNEVKADRDNALKTCQMKLSMRLSEVNQDDDTRRNKYLEERFGDFETRNGGCISICSGVPKRNCLVA
jgi:hypothetical protein